MEKDGHVGGPFVRLFSDVIEILSASSRVGTGKRYNSNTERFVKFYRERYTDPIQTTTEIRIEFSTKYFKTGVGCSSVNSARSTL